MMTPFKLYREDEKTLAPVINIGTSFRPPGVFLVERDINYVPTSFEPLRQNRFLMTFPPEFNIPEYFVKNVTRPSCNFESNTRFGLSNWTWDDITVTFYDPVHPSIQERLYNIITNTNLNTRNNYEFKIEMLDPTGIVVSSWVVLGFINRIDNGLLDYGNDSLTETKMVITVNSLRLVS
jgi:hypothetical protein